MGSLQLHLDGDDGWGAVATLESDVSVQAAAGGTVSGVPGSPEVVLAALPLLGQAVTAVSCADGALALQVGAAVVRVAPDARYEAWTLLFSNGSMVVCAGDGELVEWDGHR